MGIQRWVLAAACAASLSCVSTAQYHAAHRRRVAEINARYDAELSDQLTRRRDQLAKVDELRAYLVPVKRDAGYAPEEPVSERPEMRAIVEHCRELSEQLAAQPGARDVDTLRGECLDIVFDKAYLPALHATYYEADFDDVLATYGTTRDADLEALLAYSHNASVLRRITAMKDEIRANTQRRLARIERWRAADIRGSELARDLAIDQAEAENARALAAIGAGLQAASQAARPVPPTTTYAPTTTQTSACTSDYGCGIGRVCVKANYASTGFCAQAVNNFGNPTFDLPRLDSVGPKLPVSTDCKLPLDCPIGFTCDVRSGACLHR
jgi:hypothetical protein